MANFNKTVKTATPNAVSYEGGDVYNKNVAEDWLNFLMSCMLEDRFYESAGTQMERYIGLTEDMAKLYGNEFIAKASVFARNELGMRSIAQLTAAWLNGQKFDGKRRYFKNFCHRADDVAEIFAAIDAINGKRSHACVRGFGDYISGLKPYAIDKYKMAGKKYNMFDCINITHAKSAAIDAYKAGTLAKAETWEQKISATAGDEQAKAENWALLVLEGKLGYLALLRNIRNILDACGSDAYVIKNLCDQLSNEKSIRKSLVFPYQIYTAYKTLKAGGYTRLDITKALSDAFIIATGNMPVLAGKSAVILDVSGSMESRMSSHSNMTMKEVGAVYAAAIYFANPDDTIVIKFGQYAKLAKVNVNMNVFDMIASIAANDDCGYATYIESAYEYMTEHYDRTFLISDMQIMDSEGWSCGTPVYKKYVAEYGKSKMYSFDLANYSTQCADPNNADVYLFTTLSDKVFDFIKIAEKGGSIVDYINDNYSY